MSSNASPIVTIIVPADVRYFRSVRLAIGGLATLVGFDVEAIDDLRIAVDEMCATLSEAGNGEDIRLEISPDPGESIRIDASAKRGDIGPDQDRFRFSQQILSVVSDTFGYAAEDGEVRCWVTRDLADSVSDLTTP